CAARAAGHRCGRAGAGGGRCPADRQGARHAPGAGAPRPRPAGTGERAPARGGGEQRRRRLGRSLLLQPLLRSAGRGRGVHVTDRAVLLALQALVLGLPCMLGGRAAWTVGMAAPLVLGLLAVTVYQRRRREGPAVPGLHALVGFVALVLLTTLPIPP